MAAIAPADDKVDPKVMKTGLILVVGAIAVVFDTTIVSVALHELWRPSLDVPVSTIQWVTTGYMLGAGRGGAAQSTWALRAVRREAGLDVRAGGLPGRLDRLQPGVERRAP